MEFLAPVTLYNMKLEKLVNLFQCSGYVLTCMIRVWGKLVHSSSVARFTRKFSHQHARTYFVSNTCNTSYVFTMEVRW